MTELCKHCGKSDTDGMGYDGLSLFFFHSRPCSPARAKEIVFRGRRNLVGESKWRQS